MTSLKNWINNCSIVPFINKLSTKEDTSEFVKVWEYYTYKGLGNKADFELDMINAIYVAEMSSCVIV